MPWSWLRCVAPRLTSQASWSIRISTPEDGSSPGHDFNKAKTSLDSRLFSVKSISFLQRLAYNVLLRPGSEFFGSSRVASWCSLCPRNMCEATPKPGVYQEQDRVVGGEFEVEVAAAQQLGVYQ